MMKKKSIKTKKKRQLREISIGKVGDRAILFFIIFLVIFSTVMVASVSVGSAGFSDGDNPVLVNMLKQVVYYSIGLFLMFMCMNFFEFSDDFTVNRRIFAIAAVIITILLIITLFMPAINGAHAWLPLGIFTFQPSELVKLYIILYSAVFFPYFSRNKKSDLSDFKGPALLVGSWLFIIVVLQGDFGSALVCAIIALSCTLLIPGKKFKRIRQLTRLSFMAIFGALIFLLSPMGIGLLKIIPFIPEYQKARFYITVNPFKDIFSTAYQIFHSLLSFGIGGLMGVGYGNSSQKYGHLPEAKTDFIFPIVVEELGILGIIFIMVPYFVIFWRLSGHALRTKNYTFKILLMGTLIYLFIHFLLNIGGVSGLIPLTGVPLLLVSSGGSSSVAILTMLGICLSAIYQIKEEENANN